MRPEGWRIVLATAIVVTVAGGIAMFVGMEMVADVPEECRHLLSSVGPSDTPDHCYSLEQNPAPLLIGQLIFLLGGIVTVGAAVQLRRLKRMREIIGD